MKVLIASYHRLDLWTAPEWFAEKLCAVFPELTVVRVTSDEDLVKELPDADIVVGSFLNPQQFQQARRVRWIHSPAAGIDQLLFKELIESDVVLTNGREVHGASVAEHVIALVFALAKRIHQSGRFQQRHMWGQEILWRGGESPRSIAGATIGLVGLGSIGRNVAQRASALGMKAVAVREHPEKPKPEFVDEVRGPSQLNEMLAMADYVVLSPPVTSTTRAMIGAQQLAAMKSDAFLINVGRGSLVDEAALIEALRARRIGGAALDVFEHEPLPQDSPLWDLENLLITPHTAGMMEKIWDRHYAVFAENLRRYLAGEPLLAVVDKQGGY